MIIDTGRPDSSCVETDQAPPVQQWPSPMESVNVDVTPLTRPVPALLLQSAIDVVINFSRRLLRETAYLAVSPEKERLVMGRSGKALSVWTPIVE